VLVLSRFAGAAQQMGEALIVNPYDTHEVAEAIRTALAMPKSERIRRFERLYEIIDATDIGWWTQCYLDALAGIEAPTQDGAEKFGPKRSSSKKAAPRLRVVKPEPRPDTESRGQGETALEAAPPVPKRKGGASVKPAVAATPARNGAALGPA
jgi:trehalose 6-phosphate synthase